MSCCGFPAKATDGTIAADRPLSADQPFVRITADGRAHMDLAVPGLRCAACMSRVERALTAHPAVEAARVNLSTRRVGVDWREGEARADDIVGLIEAEGYDARPIDAAALASHGDDAEGRMLLRSLAVAGFAAANIMLLSVSVWAGAEAATRDLFHWLSAMIALPTVVYAGRPFYRSAARALASRRANMDVPISLAVILAAAISLFETIQHGPHAYFDASTTLLFFLLTGRYLDHMMRAQARSAVEQLMSLAATSALVETSDGRTVMIAAARLEPGNVVMVAAGERVPADGTVIEGTSELDRSMITGETLPETVSPGCGVHAGTLNLGAPIRVRVTATGADTFLADVVRLMEAAEHSKARYVRLADRASRLYVPVVHLAAFGTFAGWMVVTGGDWHTSLLTAIAMLIITCPCALALAVPAVQVVASGVLFRSGVMVKDGSGLERLAEIDTVLFDKTGTLTVGRPALVDGGRVDRRALAVAAGLARQSRHPMSRAIAAAAEALGIAAAPVEAVDEVPGRGLQGRLDGATVRLGNAPWCGAAVGNDADVPADGLLELWLRVGDDQARAFRFEDSLRPDAADAVAGLASRGLGLAVVSGDRAAAVAWTARQAGIADFAAALKPQDKLARIEGLAAAGRRVLMVGDGINDAPALAAGHASMAPASASDVGRTAADFVFLGERLAPMVFAIDVARRARRLIMQNFAFAVIYNMVAIPLAVAGFATPLVAAIAMSSSSLVVTANALRLRLMAPDLPERAVAPAAETVAHDPDSLARAA
jgi:P-type Cu2+ transporter